MSEFRIGSVYGWVKCHKKIQGGMIRQNILSAARCVPRTRQQSFVLTGRREQQTIPEVWRGRNLTHDSSFRGSRFSDTS